MFISETSLFHINFRQICRSEFISFRSHNSENQSSCISVSLCNSENLTLFCLFHEIKRI